MVTSRRLRARRTITATALVAAVLATLSQQPASAEVAHAKPQVDPAVPVKVVKGHPSTVKDQAAPHAGKGNPKVTWPAAGTTRLDLPATGMAAKAAAGVVKAGRPATVAAGAKVAPGAATAAAVAAAPASVDVRLMDRAAAGKVGIGGMLLQVSRTDGVAATGPAALSVDYSGFRNAYGGDWASRLRLVELPACALTTPAKAACRAATEVASRNDSTAGTVTATVDAAPAGTVYALDAAPAGSTGDYTATSLSPSATWQSGGQTGEFTWNYQIRTPPSLGGPSPYLNLSYSSGDVDGRTASTNSQPSWVGEGMEMWPGSIERKYKICADDMTATNNTPKVNDECWGGQNATLSLNGHSTELVLDDSTHVWKPKIDDGSRVELLTGAANGDDNGEYWRITTSDGIQYYFGRNQLPGWTSNSTPTNSAWTVPVFGNDSNEPCHQDTFAASWCQQAWRWNLDYVVDPHGNSLAYYYTPEQGAYGRDNDVNARTTYTRGGVLEHIDYGMRSGSEYSAKAPMKVLIKTAERCLPGSTCDSSHPASYPDVPWDQYCAAAPCTDKLAPTFFSSKRLDAITTQVLTGSSYSNVEVYTFHQLYPDPGDGTSKSLWLDSISHDGYPTGTAKLPDVKFKGVQMPNRVDGLDGEPPMVKYRVQEVDSESGGTLTVQYSAQSCSRSAPPTPDSNHSLCFPQYWTPPKEDIRLDWFNKYVTKEVVQQDQTGGGQAIYNDYSYLGDPAWHYSDDALTPAKHRTWSEWRGFQTVRTTTGAAGTQKSQADDTFFRGMDGDKLSAGTRHATLTDSQGNTLTDSVQLNGFQREHIVYATAGDNAPVATDTLNDAWQKGPTASQNHDWGTATAYLRQTGKAVTRTALSAGGWRTTEVDTTFDDHGLPLTSSDLGDTSTPNDDRCTRTSYAQNTGTWLLKLPYDVQVYAGACGTTSNFPTGAISDTLTYYDDSTTLGAAPTKGDASLVKQLAGYNNQTVFYYTASTAAHDQYGRVTRATDAGNNPTTTSYTPASGGPVTGTVVTNPLGQTQTTTLNPAWGTPTAQTDANGKTTTMTYDPLGRLAKVWLPGQVTSGTPSYQFTYAVHNDAPTVVTAQQSLPNNVVKTTYSLYDALLRQRETQAPSPNGGRIINDTVYDSRGLIASKNGPYYDPGAPGTTLVAAIDAELPAQTAYVYDGQERQTAEIFRSGNTEKWRTTTAYGGDHVDVTPPAGGTATTTYTDARGNTTELRQYHGATPTGAYDSTKYTYNTAGDQLTILNAANHLWKYTYDVRHRVIQSDDPDKGTTRYTYTDTDKVATQTDARGQQLTYDYDALGRRTGEHNGDATGPLLASWTYDTLAKGQLTSSTRYSGTSAYTTAITGYTDGYQPTGTTVTVPSGDPLAGTYTFGSTYNVDGTLDTTALPAAGGLPAETVKYRYNTLGQPTTMSGASTYVYDMKYTDYGEPTQRALGSHGQRVWLTDYYETGTHRLHQAVTERESSDDIQIGNVTYAYDDAGDVVKASDAPQDVTSPPGDSAAPAAAATDTQCYSYDYLHRLTDAWTAADGCAAAPSASTVGGVDPYWNTYAYDAAGNRLTETQHTTGAVQTNTYGATGAPGAAHPDALKSATVTGGKAPAGGSGAGPREGTPGAAARTATATPAGSSGYVYDARGDVISRTVDGAAQTLRWDAEGRLGSVTTAGATTSYTYDADGKQLESRGPQGAELFLPGMELKSDATGNKTATRYYQQGGTTVGVRTSKGMTWLSNDRNGTATIAVTSGTLDYTQRRIDPFGEPRDPAAGGSWPGDQGYVGGTTDQANDVTTLGARNYDSATGRFLSVDPKLDSDDPQQMNGYAYANNSPVTYDDADGQMPACRGMGGSDPETACPSPTRGTPSSDDDSQWPDAWSDYFGDPPAGSARLIIQGPKAPGHGIILARFFIRDDWAAFWMLTGDGRGFTNDPGAGYRMAMAWDTDTGEISITITASHASAVGSSKIQGMLGDPLAPLLLPDSKPQPPINGKGSANHASLTDVHQGDNTGFTLQYSGLNSLLPCCNIDGLLTISVGKDGTYIHLVGDDYPSFEVIQYQQGKAPRNLAKDDNSSVPAGMNSMPVFPGRDKAWYNGKEVPTSSSGEVPDPGVRPGQQVPNDGTRPR